MLQIKNEKGGTAGGGEWEDDRACYFAFMPHQAWDDCPNKKGLRRGTHLHKYFTFSKQINYSKMTLFWYFVILLKFDVYASCTVPSIYFTQEPIKCLFSFSTFLNGSCLRAQASFC